MTPEQTFVVSLFIKEYPRWMDWHDLILCLKHAGADKIVLWEHVKPFGKKDLLGNAPGAEELSIHMEAALTDLTIDFIRRPVDESLATTVRKQTKTPSTNPVGTPATPGQLSKLLAHIDATKNLK
jgi:hypothetical protein